MNTSIIVVRKVYLLLSLTSLQNARPPYVGCISAMTTLRTNTSLFLITRYSVFEGYCNFSYRTSHITVDYSTVCIYSRCPIAASQSTFVLAANNSCFPDCTWTSAHPTKNFVSEALNITRPDIHATSGGSCADGTITTCINTDSIVCTTSIYNIKKHLVQQLPAQIILNILGIKR
jgi:hypothetical protein